MIPFHSEAVICLGKTMTNLASESNHVLRQYQENPTVTNLERLNSVTSRFSTACEVLRESLANEKSALAVSTQVCKKRREALKAAINEQNKAVPMNRNNPASAKFLQKEALIDDESHQVARSIEAIDMISSDLEEKMIALKSCYEWAKKLVSYGIQANRRENFRGIAG